jgi:hypothetical protein
MTTTLHQGRPSVLRTTRVPLSTFPQKTHPYPLAPRNVQPSHPLLPVKKEIYPPSPTKEPEPYHILLPKTTAPATTPRYHNFGPNVTGNDYNYNSPPSKKCKPLYIGVAVAITALIIIALVLIVVFVILPVVNSSSSSITGSPNPNGNPVTVTQMSSSSSGSNLAGLAPYSYSYGVVLPVCTFNTWSSPGLSTGSYQYDPPTSPTQPWLFNGPSGLQGVAATGSTFDPGSPTRVPLGSQYAFLQTSASPSVTTNQMSVYLWNVSTDSVYFASVYVGTRASLPYTFATMTLSINNQVVWTSSPNLGYAGGWDYLLSSPFTIPGDNSTLTIQITDSVAQNAAILFNSLILSEITPAAQVNATQVGLTPGYLYGFDYPIQDYAGIVPQDIVAGPPASLLQPWSFSDNIGSLSCGIANQGSVYDPTPIHNPPVSCNSYAFLETSQVGQIAQMSAPWISPTAGSSHTITFYYNLRYSSSFPSSSAVATLYVGGSVVWQSSGSITSSATWTKVITSSFTLPSVTPLFVNITSASSANIDEAFLIDSFSIQ